MQGLQFRIYTVEHAPAAVLVDACFQPIESCFMLADTGVAQGDPVWRHIHVLTGGNGPLEDFLCLRLMSRYSKGMCKIGEHGRIVAIVLHCGTVRGDRVRHFAQSLTNPAQSCVGNGKSRIGLKTAKNLDASLFQLSREVEGAGQQVGREWR
jgi:hypothetical protein